ncbi:MAG: OmpA family protein [Myxococcota bacterium]|nr:OmpA family protein [Myxococcota bacterium]
MHSLLLALATLSQAQAFDSHGQTFNPGQTGAHSGVVTWNPWQLDQGSWGAMVGFELASSPLQYQIVGEPGIQPAVDGLVLANLGGSYALTDRFGIAAGLPVYLAHQSSLGADYSLGTDLQPAGAALGNLRLWVPISLVRPSNDGTGFGLSLQPFLDAPTATSAITGDPMGGGALLALGYGLPAMQFSLNLGFKGHNTRDPELPAPLGDLEEAGELSGILNAAATVQVRPDLALTTELLLSPTLRGRDSQHQADTAELMVSGSWMATERSTLIIGGATSLNSGAGVPRARVFLGTRIGKRTGPFPEESSTPTLSAAQTPYDLIVEVVDDRGRGLPAEITVLGGPQPLQAEASRRGEVILPLSEGAWSVQVSHPGYGTQLRTLELEDGRTWPPSVRVVLHPEAGDAAMSLSLRDEEDRGIEGASLSIDGQDYGSSGPGGGMQIGGLTGGDHDIQATAPGFEPGEIRVIVAAPELSDPTPIYLERPPGSVQVRVRDSAGAPVTDAQVRFMGPEARRPVGLDARGELLTQLDDGEWTVVISSERYGLQERSVVVDTDRKVLQTVDVVLAETAGAATLDLTVLDPDGNPVQGVQVSLGGVSIGQTGNGGTLSVSGLAPGDSTLALEGDRMRPEPTVPLELVEGTRELLVTMDWKPGTLQVVTRGKGQAPIDAQVRFMGDTPVPSDSVGPDGEAWYALPPGEWIVGVSAPAFGLQTREVRIEADETSLILIEAILREDSGDAALSLRVVDPKGQPVEGVRVAVDGEPVGATSTGGSLHIEGLKPGPSSVEAAGGMFHYESVDPLELAQGDNPVTLNMRWLDGTVTVRTSGPGGAPVDALIRAYGPVVLPPVQIGDSGERVLYLEPGGWTVVASSERMGIEEADVQVEAGQQALLPVTFTLSDAVAGQNSLLLVLADEDGVGISGATIHLGDAEYTTPPGGSLIIEGVTPGPVLLSATAPGYAPLESEALTLVSGEQNRSFTLDFVPQPVQVQVQDSAGNPLQAQLTWVGPARIPAQSTDAQGQADFQMRPGQWTLVAQAPEFGAARAELVLEPGVTPDPVVLTLQSSKVEVTSESVVIKEQVFFDTGKATIKAESLPLLDEVANVLLLHPEITRVEIQGHTDNVGSAETNQRLSMRRAQAVRDYLVSKGVDRKRLEATGYGASQPIESNDTAQGRAANRRVQFEIVEQEE